MVEEDFDTARASYSKLPPPREELPHRVTSAAAILFATHRRITSPTLNGRGAASGAAPGFRMKVTAESAIHPEDTLESSPYTAADT